MSLSRLGVVGWLWCVACAAWPVAAHAQSVIAGVVTDTSGAVLPGVTVEGRSPALIEQVRTAVTDDRGQYRLVDLRPGAYSVTFTLPGFSTSVRDGITLGADFTASVDVQLRVGAVEETVTVTGAAPIVDVESTRRTEVLTARMLDVLPISRDVKTLANALPAVMLSTIDVGGSNAMYNNTIQAYGGGEGQIELDGMLINTSLSDGSALFHMNTGAIAEFSYQLSGGTAETQSGGVRVSMIPKSGGDTFSGSGVALFSGESLGSANASPEQLRTLAIAPKIVDLYDYSADLGGPVFKERIWFYTSARMWAVKNTVGVLHDGKVGPVGEPVLLDNHAGTLTGRLTWQLNPKNKLAASYEWEPRYQAYGTPFHQGFLRPEASRTYRAQPAYHAQVKWTSPVTNRILLEAGFAPNGRNNVNGYVPGAVRTPAEFPPYGDIPKQDVITGISRGAPANINSTPRYRSYYQASVSYVTGSHNLKVGTQNSDGWAGNIAESYANMQQLYRLGVPFGVSVLQTPSIARVDFFDVGLFVQDSWTMGRLTLNPGVRFDKYVGRLPAMSAPANRFFPARSFDPVHDLPNWSDVALRFGAAYDVSGDGETAIKGSTGKFVTQQAMGFPSRYSPLPFGGQLTGDPRDWTDLNGNDIAEDNEIGPTRNPAFGVRRNRNPDPDLGRPYDLMHNVTFDHQITQGLGVSVAYNRRDGRNIEFTDNLNLNPDDYEMLTVPDPRGNGQTLPVYQIQRNRVGSVNELDTTSSVNSRSWQGVDVIARLRLPNDAFVIAGTSTGAQSSNLCDVENPNALRFCQADLQYRTSLKISGSYPLPWYGFRVSGVLQSLPGAETNIVYTVTRAQLPQLTTASSVAIQLTDPGSLYFDRINMVDLSLAGTIPVGTKIRVKPQFDIFNVFNTNEVLSETNQWPGQGQPKTLVPGRLIRLGLQVTY